MALRRDDPSSYEEAVANEGAIGDMYFDTVFPQDAEVTSDSPKRESSYSFRGKWPLVLAVVVCSAALWVGMSLGSGNAAQRVLDSIAREDAIYLESDEHGLDQLLDTAVHDVFGVRAIVYAHLGANMSLASICNSNVARNQLLGMFDVISAYDQLRVLHSSGEECVRINVGDDGYGVLALENELQNKSGTVYFQQALQLGKSDVYLGKLNLNVEQGEVETPLKPMIRIAVAVRDPYSPEAVEGVVVLNLFAQDYFVPSMLQHLGQQPLDGVQPFAINQEFYWILGPDASLEWGFMYGDERSTNTLDSLFPESGKLLREDLAAHTERTTGWFYIEGDGLWTYKQVVFRDLVTQKRLLRFHLVTAEDYLIYMIHRDENSLVDVHDVRSLWIALALGGQVLIALVVAGLGFVLEIGRRKKLASKRLKSVVTNISDGIIATDSRGKILFLNPVAQSMCGWENEEAVGKHISTVVNVTQRKIVDLSEVTATLWGKEENDANDNGNAEPTNSLLSLGMLRSDDLPRVFSRTSTQMVLIRRDVPRDKVIDRAPATTGPTTSVHISESATPSDPLKRPHKNSPAVKQSTVQSGGELPHSQRNPAEDESAGGSVTAHTSDTHSQCSKVESEDSTGGREIPLKEILVIPGTTVEPGRGRASLPNPDCASELPGTGVGLEGSASLSFESLPPNPLGTPSLHNAVDKTVDKKPRDRHKSAPELEPSDDPTLTEVDPRDPSSDQTVHSSDLKGPLSMLQSGNVFGPVEAQSVRVSRDPLLPFNVFPVQLKSQDVGSGADAWKLFTIVDLSEEWERERMLIDSNIKAYNAFLLEIEMKRTLSSERDVLENVLNSLFPSEVTKRLKSLPNEQAKTVAARIDNATVLFCDLVGFTHRTSQWSPEDVVLLLDGLFSIFDDVIEDFGLEKIKTIGDCYMLAGGLFCKRKTFNRGRSLLQRTMTSSFSGDPTTPRPSSGSFGDDGRYTVCDEGDQHCHTHDVALFALKALDILQAYRSEYKLAEGLELRIGIHDGPVVAGVLGKKRFAYDLWGDTVNYASRMESTCLPNRIQVSMATANILKGFYESNIIPLNQRLTTTTERGQVDIKGKGPRTTYWLEAGPAYMPNPEDHIRNRVKEAQLHLDDLRQSLFSRPPNPLIDVGDWLDADADVSQAAFASQNRMRVLRNIASETNLFNSSSSQLRASSQVGNGGSTNDQPSMASDSPVLVAPRTQPMVRRRVVLFDPNSEESPTPADCR